MVFKMISSLEFFKNKHIVLNLNMNIVYLSNELKQNCIFSMLNIFDTYLKQMLHCKKYISKSTRL